MLQRLSPSDLVQGLYTGSLKGGGLRISLSPYPSHASFMGDKLGNFQGVLAVLFALAYVDPALAKWLVEVLLSLPSLRTEHSSRT